MDDRVRSGLEGWVEALAGPEPTPAGGALALATLAGAAALAAKAARLAGGSGTDLHRLAAGFLARAERDARGYGPARREGGRRALAFLTDGLDGIREALRLLDALGPLFLRCRAEVAADVAAAERLARAATRTLVVNLAVNGDRWGDRVPGLEGVLTELARLRERLEAP